MIQDLDDPRALRIIRTLTENGHQALLVGGTVRDLVRGKAPADIDILTDAPKERVAHLFSDNSSKPGSKSLEATHPKVKLVGGTFTVCLVDGIEVASARTGKKGDGFPEDDLAKRDFTINSMALDIKTGKLWDPMGGQKDLKKGIIRFTDNPQDRILEDPLRMIRACRFAALLEGRLSKKTADAIRGFGARALEGVAKERILQEVLKSMALPKPSLFFKALLDTGLLGSVLPSLNRCTGLDGGPHHRETVFEHCLLAGDALPARQPWLRLAGYLHDVGKFDAAYLEDGHLTFAGHETCLSAIEKDLDTLRAPVRKKAYVLSLVKGHMRPLSQDTTPKAVRRLLAMLADLSISFEDFMRLRIADKKSNLAKHPYTLNDIRIRVKKVNEQRTLQTAFSINDLALSGRQIMTCLNLSPGPDIGRIKQQLFEKVLDDPSLNTPETLETMLLDESINLSQDPRQP